MNFLYISRQILEKANNLSLTEKGFRVWQQMNWSCDAEWAGNSELKKKKNPWEFQGLALTV